MKYLKLLIYFILITIAYIGMGIGVLFTYLAKIVTDETSE